MLCGCHEGEDIQILVRWDVTPYTVVDRQNVLHAHALPIFRVEKNTSTLKMEAAGSFKTLVPLYQTTWLNMPGDHTVLLPVYKNRLFYRQHTGRLFERYSAPLSTVTTAILIHFLYFSSVPTKWPHSTYIRPRPIPSKFFPSHPPSTTLFTDAMSSPHYKYFDK
jgi:hypothetical protein